MEKFRKSFKNSKPPEEERQVLLTTMAGSGSSPPSSSALIKEVVIKIDGHGSELSSPSETQKSVNEEINPVWRDSSYDFTNDLSLTEIEKAKNVSSNKDFDFVTENPSPPLSNIPENVSPEPEPYPFRRRFSGGGASGEINEVVICSSNSLRRKSFLLKTKTKSRLIDPNAGDQELNKSRMLRSGVLKSEFDDEDPFSDEDLPDEYKKLKLFSPLTILQLLSLILIITGLVCTLVIKGLREKTIFELEYWKWELMILVLICGRLVSGWGIRVVVFFIERNFLLRKRVLYFVYGLRNSVQNCVWLSLVLIAWQCIFDKKVDEATKLKVLPYVTKIWICLLVTTFIWLLKTLLVKVLAMSFHVNTFFDRIQESLFNQYVIETLSGPPLIELQHEQEEEERLITEVQKLQNAGAKLPDDLKQNMFSKKIGTPRKSPVLSESAKSAKSSMFSRLISKKEQEQTGITIDHLHKLNQKNISAWNMKRLINIVRKGVLSTLDEQLEQSVGEDETAVQITSEKQAKVAAKRIFNNVAKLESKYIHLEDLMCFLREEEALKTIRLFEGGAENKGISKSALKNWVVNVFRERRALALSLNDTKTAVNKLHHMANGVVGIIIFVIWLLILKVATTHFFVFLSSQLLLVVFMFGNTCKTTFEAIIFLFVMHPFDVGDRVEVDTVQMIVEEMNILTTVFLRFDNQKITYPNSVLSTKPIANFYRSPDMGDAIDFCIHISTPLEKIATMKERIIKYIEEKSDHWYPAPSIVMRDVEDMNKIKWSVWLSHTMNFQDMGERWKRRSLLVEEMVKVFKDLDIEYRMLPVDVNVRNMPSLSSTRLPSNWTACALAC